MGENKEGLPTVSIVNWVNLPFFGRGRPSLPQKVNGWGKNWKVYPSLNYHGILEKMQPTAQEQNQFNWLIMAHSSVSIAISFNLK